MFNLFKKKKRKPTIESILCIPGPWKSKEELVKAVALNNIDQFLLAGQILMDLKENIGYNCMIEEVDSNIPNAFEVAGTVTGIESETIDELRNHKLVVYLIGVTGEKSKAADLARAANCLIKAGGLGVKIETAGKAFGPDKWSKLVNEDLMNNLYQLFVIDSISDGNGTMYSCGMHNLGMKDSIISGDDNNEIHSVLSTFGMYQVYEDAKLNAGETFSINTDSIVYEIDEEHNQPNLGLEDFENKFGMWKLTAKKYER